MNATTATTATTANAANAAATTVGRALPPGARFELRFQPLREDRIAVCVPCDEAGHVNLDALEEPARLSYYFARTVIGRDFARPRVQTVGALH